LVIAIFLASVQELIVILVAILEVLITQPSQLVVERPAAGDGLLQSMQSVFQTISLQLFCYHRFTSVTSKFARQEHQ
jgi:hypothetical protein